MDENQLLYQVALGMIPGIGSITAKKLIDYAGDLPGIFNEKESNLQKIPGIGSLLSHRINDKGLFARAEREVDYILKNKIRALFYRDKDYPERLNLCHDAPLMIYIKGSADLNVERIISIVGTRNPTDVGLNSCKSLIRDIAGTHPGTVIVSGLAYGIDITAHRAALKHKLPTVAVLGHGFRYLYPSIHRSTARKIEADGALLTEFCSTIKPERNNFIRRNRVIAGISDATTVVQSPSKGGALITAGMANSYNRDVFAVPGRIEDKQSAGCNYLIKSHRASLIENIGDLEYLLGWNSEGVKEGAIQTSMFADLSEDDKIIVDILSDNQIHSVDSLCLECKMPVSKLSSVLLKLEFSGLIYCMPGNLYRMSN